MSKLLTQRLYAFGETAAVLVALWWALLIAPESGSRFRFVGLVPAGADGWSYSLYQENEFEPATGVYCEVYYRGQRQSELAALFGSHDQVEVTDFRAGQCGPVLYLRYLTEDTAMQLHALYDTRWRAGYYDSLREQESHRQQVEREQQLRRRAVGCWP
ncbi:hypothetical protein [Hymenobacter sp. B81]|uniref:hypothetical protein n=1 Tax=Hymenobacter sp. B81 TaxID=3344878 RepID=UPI0037DCF2E1